MKFSSVTKVLAYIWHSKKIWRKPGKATVLIVDRAGSEVLLTYLDTKSVEILDLRGESLNLYVLLKCLLKWKLSKIDYIFQYLACVKPNVVLTFIDNNHLFYQLKSRQNDLITIFVQNGLRGEYADVFGFFKMQTHCRNKYQVSYMLTFGNAIGREYSKYIEGNALPIGSFKNNLYQSETKKQKNYPAVSCWVSKTARNEASFGEYHSEGFKTVLFLSQYRPLPSPESMPMVTYDDQPIFWKQVYSAEEFLLPLLQQYCLQNKLELEVCGCSADQTKEERNYFRFLLKNETLEPLKKVSSFSSYEKIAAAEFVVFVDTTLGYEALARGKKTAAFTLRGKLLGLASRNFGWPADIPDNGPFWTNHADECEFKRVMDYITTVSDEEWEQTRQQYVPELMEYDPGNTRFLKLMREIGVPLK